MVAVKLFRISFGEEAQEGSKFEKEVKLLAYVIVACDSYLL